MTSDATPSVDVVIVNWNTRDYLATCLRSIVDARRTAYELERVVVVDNASTDDSLASAEELPLPLTLIRNDENRGFAAACNQGAREGSADLILFLNPDTRPAPDAIDRTVAFMAEAGSADVGICGARMVGAEGEPGLSTSRFPTLWMLVTMMTGASRAFPGRFPPQRVAPVESGASGIVDQVIGAFFLVRRPLFEALDGFDERFFVYMEEVDLAYRARQLGFSSYHLATASVYHAERVSSDQVRGRRLAYLLESRTAYARKHWPAWQALVLALLVVVVELPVRAVRAAARDGRAEALDVLAAARSYLRYLVAGTSSRG